MVPDRCYFESVSKIFEENVEKANSIVVNSYRNHLELEIILDLGDS